MLWVLWAASVPITKSALLVKFPNPVIELVKDVPDVFTYNPMLSAATEIGFLPVVVTTVGVCTTPPAVIVAVAAPAGASIATGPTFLVVGVEFIECSSFEPAPETVIVPLLIISPPFNRTP